MENPRQPATGDKKSNLYARVEFWLNACKDVMRQINTLKKYLIAGFYIKVNEMLICVVFA